MPLRRGYMRTPPQPRRPFFCGVRIFTTPLPSRRCRAAFSAWHACGALKGWARGWKHVPLIPTPRSGGAYLSWEDSLTPPTAPFGMRRWGSVCGSVRNEGRPRFIPSPLDCARGDVVKVRADFRLLYTSLRRIYTSLRRSHTSPRAQSRGDAVSKDFALYIWGGPSPLPLPLAQGEGKRRQKNFSPNGKVQPPPLPRPLQRG